MNRYDEWRLATHLPQARIFSQLGVPVMYLKPVHGDECQEGCDCEVENGGVLVSDLLSGDGPYDFE